MGLNDYFKDIILISFGAVLGANTRFLIYKRLDQLNLSKNRIILLINILASFSLGLFLSLVAKIDAQIYSDQLKLLFSIGLLGSLSTFSSFICNLYDLFIKLKFKIAFKLFIISLTSGVLAFAVGFLLFMQ